MAIYSNFDGTHKDAIRVGKKGLKLVKDGGAFKITDNADALVVMKLADPTSADHASTKKYVDDKFGTTGLLVRTNAESDALYEALARKNVANGYAGLGTDGKIEKQYLPSLVTNATYTVHNYEERNVQAGVNQGDMMIINSIPVWQPDTAYNAGELVKAEDANFASGFIFVLCGADHVSGSTTLAADIIAQPTWWIDSNWPPGGGTYDIGQEYLHGNILYIATAGGTNIATEPKDNPDFRADSKADAGLFILKTSTFTPAVGFVTSDDDWASVDFGAQVATYNGRIGNVQPETGDYNGSQVVNVPNGDITAINLQNAINQLDTQRVKRTGDTMAGALIMASGSKAIPGIQLPGSTNSGLFESTGSSIGVSANGEEVIRIGAQVELYTEQKMNSKRILNVGNPVDNGDAVNKEYVDAKPTIFAAQADPAPTTGKHGDVYLTTLTGGQIQMASSSRRWNDIVANGDKFLAVSDLSTNPIGASSINGGLSWAAVSMRSAPSATDRYKQIVTNSKGSFVANRTLINNASSSSTVVYTLDGGMNWSTTNIPENGQYVAANIESDGTKYLFALPGTTKAYTSTTGATWDTHVLPITDQWVAGAGASNRHVIIGGASSSSNNAVYTLDGLSYIHSVLPLSQKWKSIYSSDGTNYVAVGWGPTDGDTDKAVYSIDGGVTWSMSTLPSAGKWSAVISHGGAFVAVKQGSNEAAVSLDNGASWVTKTLPSTGSWSKLASDGRSIIAIDTNLSTTTPLAVSTDGGNTWFNEVDGAISAISVKDNAEWLTFESLTTSGSDFVLRSGSRMTGALVVDNGKGRKSITTSGTVNAADLEASKQVLNNSDHKQTGKVVLGAANADSVSSNCTYQWTLGTEGNNADIDLKITSMKRGTATPVTLMTAKEELVTWNANQGLGTAYTAAGYSVDHDTHTVDSSFLARDLNGKASSHFVSMIKDNGSNTYAVRVADASGPKAGIYGTGDIFTKKSLRVGATGINAATVISATASSVNKTQLYLSSVSLADSTGGVNSLNIVSKDNNKLASDHNHIIIHEGNTVVFKVNKEVAVVNKSLAINATSAEGLNAFIGGTDGVRLPAGTTADRPANPPEGTTRLSYDVGGFDIFLAGQWASISSNATSQSREIDASMWLTIDGEHRTFIHHQLGSAVSIQIQEKVGDWWVGVHMDYAMNATGSQVKLSIPDTEPKPTDKQYRYIIQK